MVISVELTAQETEALRLCAARENRSMQEVAEAAVRNYVERATKNELVEEVLEDELLRYSEALRRLGE